MKKEESINFHPNYAIAPGNTLKETLKAIGMTRAEFAKRIGYSIKTINEIIKGEKAITTEMAIKLESAVDIPASFWSSLEYNYRDFLSRKKE